ncbi:MAG: ATP synthase subunit I [Desulfomonile tiedjei]|uniref:ATP synthase subunit I n=1 Tax=Desulfomonile tiedjei TaxID=2358 RepID=A0A9D6Z5Y4_9BACT|nr:ATP synthase subunit I [Desulfomonile tiedjei]
MKAEKIPGIWFVLSSVAYLVGLPVCLLAAPIEFTLGFASGGALVLLNAWMSARKVRKADFPNRGRVIASLLGGFYLRLILLGVCLYAFIKFVHVDPVGLVTGLSVVPLGLFFMLVLIYVANRRPEEV